MAKVTSKYQVTIPKKLAEQYGIKPGDELEWKAAGDSLRVVPQRNESAGAELIAMRLKMFQASVERQKKRERARGKQPQLKDRGWTREELYDRGRTR